MSCIEEKVGARVAGHRKLAGLSQAQLAERVGVTTETISRIETGATRSPLRRIKSIADALGIELHHLFRFRSGKSPEDEAIDRLLRLLSNKTASEIDLAGGIVASAFDYLRRRGS